ncbi:MAG: acyl carrier protein [Lachnospiraceae bacterium]|nr:acyl carrier protein [Lachnospiraceae bacterium]
MDELLEILNDLHPEVDYDSEEALLDDGILDEDDIDTIVTEVQENFDVTIDPDDVTPANFNSARAIYALIESLSE